MIWIQVERTSEQPQSHFTIAIPFDRNLAYFLAFFEEGLLKNQQSYGDEGALLPVSSLAACSKLTAFLPYNHGEYCLHPNLPLHQLTMQFINTGDRYVIQSIIYVS